MARARADARERAAGGLLSQDELRGLIERLASIHRPSASAGEREAAELIAAELAGLGLAPAIEEERAHGGYWWPIGLFAGLAAAAAASRSRPAKLVLGAVAAAGIVDDTTGGRHLHRRLLPSRTTANVLAFAGDRDAARTVVLVAHHDAAHSGLIFHPELARGALRRSQWLRDHVNTSVPAIWLTLAGPLLTALAGLTGSRRLARAGAVASAGTAAAMADIGSRPAVPGANDNLSSVAVLVSLARSLRDDPIPGLRVLLLSTGSEESFMEGMRGFAARHFPQLPPETTTVLCLDTVGSPRLAVLEGEGMVWMNDYPAEPKATITAAAGRLGVELVPDLRFSFATDGLIALRRGYPTATIVSVDEFKFASNYHWPSDVPENLEYATVADCAALVRATLEDLAP